MKQFRDADYNVRLISTEGFCRMLMSQSCDKPIDFIARLMLLCFEKVDIGHRQLTDQDSELHKKIKSTIEDFLGNYVRLSKGRCTEVTAATIAVINYLLKAKSSLNTSMQFRIDPSFLSINLFYLFGTVADLLKYEYNRSFAIFDFAEFKVPLSFQLQFFEYFTLSQLSKKQDQLTPDEDSKMCNFLIDALDFMHFEELPVVLRNFEESYEGSISKLFCMLCTKLQLFHYSETELAKVKAKWAEQAREYLKIKNPSVNPEDHMKRKLIEFAHKTPSKQALQEQA
jgi:hypothetical protein